MDTPDHPPDETSVAQDWLGLSHCMERNPDPPVPEPHALQRLLELPLTPMAFRRIATDVFDEGKMSLGWRAAFEHAHRRLPENKRPHVRNEMIAILLHFGDCEAAMKYLPAEPHHPHELRLAMRVFLGAGRVEKAKNIFETCKRLVEDHSDGNLDLLEAIEAYHLAFGQWDEAIALWNSVKLSHSVNPFHQLARLHVLRAQAAIRHGLDVIRESHKQEQEAAKHKTGRTFRRFAGEKRALKRCTRALRRIAPLEDHIVGKLGMGPSNPPVSSDYDARHELQNLIMQIEEEWQRRASNPPVN